MNWKWIFAVSLVLIFPSFAKAQQSSYSAYLAVVQELQLNDIRTAILSSGLHGMDPNLYWTTSMEDKFRSSEEARSDLKTEALRAYLLLLQHASLGVVDPESMGIDVKLKRKSFISAQQLQVLRLVSANRALPLLDSVAPQSSQYIALKESLRRFTIYCQGTMENIPSFSRTLKLGDVSPVIPYIKKRLRQYGYRVSNFTYEFDEDVLSAVNDIQWTLNTKPDGSLTPRGKTIKYLNEPCQSRIQQIRLDMEKLRWFPSSFEDRHIFVNLATAHFTLADRTGRTVSYMNFRTIVGREARKTPTMRDRITHIIINPFWVVPPTIFREDKMEEIRNLLPEQINQYFESRNYEVWNRGLTRKIDPASIDWWQENPTLDAEIYIRQRPSEKNALGLLKFMMTNYFAIYLHDTNQRELFQSARRQLSSGCIRLEQPVELAEFLLRGTAWTREAIENHMAKPGEVLTKDTRVNLPQSMPVYMAALTSQLSSDGVMRFTGDIYRQNERLLARGAHAKDLQTLQELEKQNRILKSSKQEPDFFYY